MSNELTPKLKKQLDDESREYAAMFKYGKEYRQNAHFDGAKSFVLKWQEAEQRSARYEKALKWLRAYAINSQNNGTIPSALVIYSTINQALTPKQTTDDTVNR